MNLSTAMTCKDEADIIEISLRHQLAEGVDRIFIADASTDGTREIIDALAAETGRIEVFTDDDQYCNQPGWTNRLIGMARDAGADWIMPNDVDEFTYGTSGQTVAETLDALPESVTSLVLRVYPHLNWSTRFVNPHGMTKVAFRGSPDATVSWGNHHLYMPGATQTHDVLDMRELQYRGFDHFKRKAKRAWDNLSPYDKANGTGGHHTYMEGMSEEQMRAEHDRIMGVPMTADPIPTHLVHPSLDRYREGRP